MEKASALNTFPPTLSGMETLGQRIKRLRLGRGLTQAQVIAHIPGMTASALSQLENGLTNGLKADNLVGLSKALGVSAQEIMTGRASIQESGYIPVGDEGEIDELTSIWRRLPGEIKREYMARLREVVAAYDILQRHGVTLAHADVKGRLPPAPQVKAVAAKRRKKR